MTARAVKYSIERALSPKLGTPRPAETYLADLEQIRARGNRISFTLRAASPDFLERLSLPYYCTVPSGTPIVNGGLQPIAPPSTGPYYMAARANGAWTVLKRNPYYRGPHPAPLDAIVVREGLDAEKAVGEVERGDWQGLALTDRVVLPGSAVARRYARPGSSLAYRVLPELHLDYLALNAGRGPLRDVSLRRRVAAALDRSALAANEDDDTPTSSLLPRTRQQHGPSRACDLRRTEAGDVAHGRRERLLDVPATRRSRRGAAATTWNHCEDGRSREHLRRTARGRRADRSRGALDRASVPRPGVVPDADARARRAAILASRLLARRGRETQPALRP